SGNEIAFSGYIDSAKKLLGTFPADYYATYHLRDYEKTENDTQLPTTLEAAPMMENENVGIASSQKPAFKIVTLWQNGRKAQETTYIYSAYGSPQKLRTTSWAK